MPADLYSAISTTPNSLTDAPTATSLSPRLGRLRRLSHRRPYPQHITNDNTVRVPANADRPGLSRDRSPHIDHSSLLGRVDTAPSPTAITSLAPEPESVGILARLTARRARLTPIDTSQAPLGCHSVGQAPAGSDDNLAQTSPTAVSASVQAAFVSDSRREPASMPRFRSATSPIAQAPSSTPIITESRVPVDWSTSFSRRHMRRSATDAPAPMLSDPAQQVPSSQTPSIRFVPYQDPRSPRPSLNFPTTTRTLPNGVSTIRVGRYSEKETAAPATSTSTTPDAPVGFKSKVVSRRHCEFAWQDNQWYIRDVKSSSGTFLNHIRLSPPGEESRMYAVKDGDLVQLGIDFKGGEEMIFRCVKIRILCNRGWQKSLNKFNKSAHKQLNDLQRGSGKNKEDVADASTECTICLNPIAPCQSLFVAPCSHTWHYKCIRPILDASRRATSIASENLFSCPNCRNIADLDADVDDVVPWEDSDDIDSQLAEEVDVTQIMNDSNGMNDPGSEDDLASAVHDLSIRDAMAVSPSSRNGSIRGLNPSASDFIPLASRAASISGHDSSDHASTETNGTSNAPHCLEDEQDLSASIPVLGSRAALGPLFVSDIDGPLTPRNHAGPFVFDGTASASAHSSSRGVLSWVAPKPGPRLVDPTAEGFASIDHVTTNGSDARPDQPPE